MVKQCTRLEKIFQPSHKTEFGWQILTRKKFPLEQGFMIDRGGRVMFVCYIFVVLLTRGLRVHVKHVKSRKFELNRVIFKILEN